MKEGNIPRQGSAQHQETTAASELARMSLEKQVQKGKTIEIPSLGIVVTKDMLKNPSKRIP